MTTPRLFSGLAALAILFASGPHVTAADDEAQDFPVIKAQWDDLNGKLDALEKKFLAADAAAREEIRETYGQHVAAISRLVPRLRSAAITSYRAAPNADPELVALLIGMAASDVRRDRYESAMELAAMLIENECSDEVIFSVAGTAAYGQDEFDTAEKYLTIAHDAEKLGNQARNCLTDLDLAKKSWKKEVELRRKEAQADDLPRVQFLTSKGKIVIELYENEAPQAVGNFVSLVERGFYDGRTFHRVLGGFMAQGGCPKGDGSGGPGYEIPCECYRDDHRKHFRGTLSMAHAGRDTGGSQFFLTFRRTAHLDGVHTVFGRVIEGINVLAELQRIDPNSRGTKPQPDKIIKATVLRKRDHEYKPTKVE